MSAREYSRYPAQERACGTTRPMSSKWCSVRTLTPTRRATSPTVRPASETAMASAAGVVVVRVASSMPVTVVPPVA